MDNGPTLPDLTPDDRIWRLDWFGDIAYRPVLRRHRQPCIKIVLSALVCDQNDNDALLKPTSTDHKHPHEAWLPISTLPLLAIGDLWQNGRQIASLGYQLESFKKLRIDQETASFIKAGLAIDEHYLLPLNEHPWHRNHTQSYCAMVTMKDKTRLIVPCMELIRFYFGSSGNFLQRLFTNPLDANSLWTKKRFNEKTRHLHLVLADRISGVSASDIGRIAASKLAWRAAAGIFSSSQKASVQGIPVYPYTGFPFEGSTDLLAHGKWLTFGERENSTFLVYRLRSCSYPFPFRSLSYEAADRNARYSSGGGNSQKKTSATGRSKATKSQTVNRDPGDKKRQRRKTFKTNVKFPDLVRKQVWREKLEALPKADVFLKRSDGCLEQVAFGEPGGEHGITSLEATQESDEKISSLPKFVQEGLKDIHYNRKLVPEGATIKLVSPKGRSGIIFTLPIVVDENGEFDEVILFFERNGHTRQRMVCLVEIGHMNSHIQRVVIIEGHRNREGPSILKIASNDISYILEILRSHDATAQTT